MKNKLMVVCVIAAVGMLATSAHAAFDVGVTPDVIFGSGNANGGFTVAQADGVELGLRAKLRHNASGLPENAFNSNGDGTYSFDAGVAPFQSTSTAVWSFEWSINSNVDGSGGSLNAYTYALRIDSDATAGTNFLAFDPINASNPGANDLVLWDHAIGTNNTGNGGGTSAGDATQYASLIGSNNVAQNSWKPHWFIPLFDPTVDGTYTFELEALDGGVTIAMTSMDVIVGAGAAVPEPGSLLIWGLLGIGCAAMGVVRRRRRTA